MSDIMQIMIICVMEVWRERALVFIISLIPRLSRRLSYLSFRTISRSCVSSPNYHMAAAAFSAYVYIMHMNPMCVTQSAARGTVKSELGQWIRITIIGARNWSVILNWWASFIVIYARTDLDCAHWLRIKYAKLKIDCSGKFEPRGLLQFCSFFSIKCRFFVFSMSEIKQLTNGIVWNGKSITSMW